MRSTLLRLSACALVAVATTATAAAQQLELPRPSPNAKVTQTVGVTDISVDYSSPAVRGRKIWGGLVPYGQVWRAGANAATKITFSRDVVVGKTAVPAGSYSFFVLPTANKWTLILNKDANQFGAFTYKKGEDLVRVEVKPQPAPMRERLAYAITNFTDSTASLDLEWEKVKVSLPIKLHTDEQVAASIKGLQSGGWSPWAQAARWELDQKHYDTATQLVDKSIEIKPTWLNTFVKAQLLAARGNYKEAHALAEKAKAMGEQQPQGFFMKDQVEAALKTWKTKS
jgi:hypothetical protein